MTKSRSTLVVCSEAQLFKTQPAAVVVKALAKSANRSENYVTAMMMYDQFIAPNLCGYDQSVITGFKSGKIKEDGFYKGIRQRLGKTAGELPDETIRKDWNSMCIFSESAQNECKETVAFLQKHPTAQLLLISETNSLQHERNLEQFKQAVGDAAYTGVAKQLHFINSHEMGFLGKGRLSTQGVTKLQKEGSLPENAHIGAVISLHSAMPSQSVLSEGINAAAAMKGAREYQDIKTTGASNIAQMISEKYAEMQRGQPYLA